MGFCGARSGRPVNSWLLEPLRDSNLELFALVAVWIASKIQEVTAYVISVRKQRWEFPILPWVKFTTSYEEEEIMKIVLTILMHVLKPDEIKDKNKRLFSI